MLRPLKDALAITHGRLTNEYVDSDVRKALGSLFQPNTRAFHAIVALYHHERVTPLHILCGLEEQLKYEFKGDSDA